MKQKVFASFDLAGAEWAIVAYLTGDPGMLRVVEQGLSPHTNTASLMFGIDEAMVLAEEKALEGCTDPATLREWRNAQGITALLPAAKTARQGGKECNFSLNYDVGPNTFSERTMNSLSESRRLIRLYRTVAYPRLPKWHKHIQRCVHRDGYLVNCFGRRRDFYSQPGENMYRVAYAYLPQSTVYDVTRKAMVRVYEEEPEIELLMQVHDELVTQMPCDPAFIAEAIPRMIRYLTVPLLYADPQGVERAFALGVDAKVGFSKNKRFMKSLPKEADADAVRAVLCAAGELVGWGEKVSGHLKKLAA